MRKLIIASFFWALGLSSIAQENQIVQSFKDTRIVNGHSVETNFRGEMKFIISHRFGAIGGGAYELFGLDQASMRMGLDYGITDKLNVGIGRSTFEKTIDGFAKYRLLSQTESNSTPLSITLLSTIAVNGLKWADPDRENFFSSRLFYTHQVLIARKFHHRFSLQLMPTVVHRNLVANENIAHDVYTLGGAFRFQLSKQVALQGETYLVNQNDLGAAFQAPISIGFDVETKGHVFQFHFSNSRGMIEKFFITETKGSWGKGDIHFGFNITRDFRIRGPK
jgi:hypothetical protein